MAWTNNMSWESYKKFQNFETSGKGYRKLSNSWWV